MVAALFWRSSAANLRPLRHHNWSGFSFYFYILYCGQTQSSHKGDAMFLSGLLYLFGPPKIDRVLTSEERIKPLLPVGFDKNCNGHTCKKRPMEFMEVTYCTRRKPFATYQCTRCKRRLLIFKAPVTPLLVWSEEYAGYTNFSNFIERELIEREAKLKRRLVRYGLSGLIIRIWRSLYNFF